MGTKFAINQSILLGALSLTFFLFSVPRSTAQTEEEFVPFEEVPVGETIEGESGPGFETDGLTPMYSWPPESSSYFYKFKYAAVCHDYNSSGGRDVYGIAAVFQLKSGTTYWDRLYYLRIEGHSTYPNYGQLLTSTLVSSQTEIYNVDCTSNDSGSIFITWDMYNNNVRWARFVGTTMYGPPYTIGEEDHCVGPGIGGGYYYSRKPRIAYADPYPFVMLVYYGYNYATGAGSSLFCMSTWWAYTGEFINDNYWWPDAGDRPRAWDVEWNGDDRFIVAYYPRPDMDYPLKFRTAQFDYYCNMIADYVIEDWGFPPVPPPPVPDPDYYDMKLVYTDGNKNTENRLVLQTSNGITYWLNQEGDKYIDDYEPYRQYNPRYQYGGQYGDYFAVCEYWGGAANRIAHTFGYNFFFDPGPPPIGFANTRHMHWDMRPTSGDPHALSSLNEGYFPAACNAADTLTDTELLLVSRAAGGDKYVFWNMEPQ